MTDKPRRTWLRLLGYAGFFVICLLLSLYLTFPMGALKPRIVDAMQKALAQAGPAPGRYGVPSEIKVGKVDLYGLSGVELTRLDLRLASRDPDPAPTWAIDRARVRLQLLPLILGKRWLSFEVQAYDGQVDGELLLVDNRPAVIEAQLDGLAVGKIPAVLAKLGVPLEGTLSGEAKLHVGKGPKEYLGSLKLAGAGYVLGPGEIKIPGLTGGLTVPAVDLGTLQVEATVKDGKARVKPIELHGKDVKVDSDLTVNLRSPVGRSSTSGALILKLEEAFLKANKKFQPILDFTPQLKRAKAKDGSYRFKMAGMLSSLRPVPDKRAKIN